MYTKQALRTYSLQIFFKRLLDFCCCCYSVMHHTFLQYFDLLHPFLPHLPLPLAITNLFSLSIKAFIFKALRGNMIFVFLIWFITLRIMPLRAIHDIISFFFYGWVIFCCVYVCACVYIHILFLLYPFIHWWTFGLFLYLVYRKQCCNKHLHIDVLFSFILSSGKYLEVELLGHKFVTFITSASFFLTAPGLVFDRIPGRRYVYMRG